MLSFPFNSLDADPLLQQKPVPFRRPRSRDRAEDLGRGGCGGGGGVRAAGAVCGFTTSWPSSINVENFSAYHNLPISTEANGFGGLDAVL